MDPVTITLPIGDDSPKADLYYGVSVLEGLGQLPDRSIHCVVTSPPYYGMRSYGTEPQVWGGSCTCEHLFKMQNADHLRSNPGGEGINRDRGFDGVYQEQHGFCARCGAWKGNLGIEPKPEAFIQHLVMVFDAVKRVLRDDGTLWVNLGDTYSWRGSDKNIKPKDLIGIPWRFALAMQEQGWWLRNDIIWEKTNRIPDPVPDRLAVSYEHIFLFTKAKKYFFDLDAIRIPHTYGCYSPDGSFEPAQQWLSETGNRTDRKMDKTQGELGSYAGPPRRIGRGLYNVNGKNPGNIWRFPLSSYPGAHFATFCQEIPERCILAGTSEKGICATCGAPWNRSVKRSEGKCDRPNHSYSPGRPDGMILRGGRLSPGMVLDEAWDPSCTCTFSGIDRPVVLDPFSGSGTTGQVALRLGRNYIGIDLNPEYLPLATRRILDQEPPEKEVPEEGTVLDLFGGI